MACLENRWNVAELLKYDKTTQCIVICGHTKILPVHVLPPYDLTLLYECVEPRLKAKLYKIENCIPVSVTPGVLSFVLM